MQCKISIYQILRSACSIPIRWTDEQGTGTYTETLFITGGISPNSLSGEIMEGIGLVHSSVLEFKNYLGEVTDRTWPSLKQARLHHACGTFTDNSNNQVI